MAGNEEPVEKRAVALSGMVQSVLRASENESWGLNFEAAEDYQSASFELKHAALPEVSWFSEEEKDIFTAVGTALYHKYSKLSGRSTGDGDGNFDGKQLSEGDGASGELTLAEAAMEMEKKNLQAFLDMPESEYEAALEKATQTKAGSLVKRRDVLPGYSYLDITIERIGMREPQSFVEPFITVSVKGLKGEDVELSQDTPVTSEREDAAVVFNVTAQIQHPLEEIPGGAAIFFEFKHFKPKKKMVSTKCFSFMGMDEIKDGKTVLEIYKKPTDFRRKKLALLSAKPQYLHLNLTVRKP